MKAEAAVCCVVLPKSEFSDPMTKLPHQRQSSMDHPVLRWLTAVLIICGAVVLGVFPGLDIVRFAMTDRDVDADAGPTQSQIEAVRPWVDALGLAFYARDPLVTPLADSRDEMKVRKRRYELMEILSIRPTSSKHWLVLAETRLAAGEPSEKVTDTLRLSVLTGTNEGSIMGRRGLFGLWRWESLPPDLQKRAVVDLAANPEPLSVGQISWLERAISKKTEIVRAEIRTALLAEGFPAKGLTAIGL
jgi:hypothetical protein